VLEIESMVIQLQEKVLTYTKEQLDCWRKGGQKSNSCIRRRERLKKIRAAILLMPKNHDDNERMGDRSCK
jgi:hypothetical protein